MKYDIRYVGELGTVEMSAAPIIYQEQNFFGRKHGYTTTNLISGRGSRLSRFYREATEYTLNLMAITGTRAAANSILEGMQDVFEHDVTNQKPGRLYVNGSYLNCYVVSSESEDKTFVGKYFAIQLTLLAEKPLWIREELLSFGTFTADSSSGFILPTAIPFGLTSSAGIKQLIVDYHASVLAEISLFGPSVNPSFSIGSHLYQVNGTLLAGERFVINQMDKTVTKITNSGEVINAFNLRSKTSSVFEPIPAGENILTYSGDFAISINLFYERGEPQWS